MSGAQLVISDQHAGLVAQRGRGRAGLLHQGGVLLGHLFQLVHGAHAQQLHAHLQLGPQDVERAWQAGAQGVAGIRAFWPKAEG